MSRRYGRNQKRAHLARIAELEAKVAGWDRTAALLKALHAARIKEIRLERAIRINSAAPERPASK